MESRRDQQAEPLHQSTGKILSYRVGSIANHIETLYDNDFSKLLQDDIKDLVEKFVKAYQNLIDVNLWV